VWLNRFGASYPAIFSDPTYTVTSIEDIAELWSDSQRV
jgi:hypothetical protein